MELMKYKTLRYELGTCPSTFLCLSHRPISFTFCKPFVYTNIMLESSIYTPWSPSLVNVEKLRQVSSIYLEYKLQSFD